MSFKEDFSKIKDRFDYFKQSVMKEISDIKEQSENAKDEALEACDEIAEVASEGLTWLKNEVDSFREYLKNRNKEEKEDAECSE